MKFQLLIKNKMLKILIFLALKHFNVVFILLINVKMPKMVGILTFISRINFESFITLRPGPSSRHVVYGTF